MTVAGVDRAAGRWVTIEILDDGSVTGFMADTAHEVGEWLGDASVIAIDIPIGLPQDRIGRVCDDEARAMLGGGGSSVFPALPKHCYEDPYDLASRDRSRQLYGRAYSSQAWNLGRAILEVDAVAAGDSRWIETHPEVAFASRNAQRSLPSKKSWAGLAARLAILADEGVELDAMTSGAGRAPIDDVVDAAICAVVARAHAQGDASYVGSSGPRIWF